MPAIAAPARVEILIMCFDIFVSIAFNRLGLAIKRRTSAREDYSVRRGNNKKMARVHLNFRAASSSAGVRAGPAPAAVTASYLGFEALGRMNRAHASAAKRRATS